MISTFISEQLLVEKPTGEGVLINSKGLYGHQKEHFCPRDKRLTRGTERGIDQYEGGLAEDTLVKIGRTTYGLDYRQS